MKQLRQQKLNCLHHPPKLKRKKQQQPLNKILYQCRRRLQPFFRYQEEFIILLSQLYSYERDSFANLPDLVHIWSDTKLNELVQGIVVLLQQFNVLDKVTFSTTKNSLIVSKESHMKKVSEYVFENLEYVEGAR